MKQLQQNAEEQIASPKALDQNNVVTGPSCPEAFAEWWAEYRRKLMRSGSANCAGCAKEGLW
jgi:hypothetical protein